MFASRRIPHRPTGQAQRVRCKVPADRCWAAGGQRLLADDPIHQASFDQLAPSEIAHQGLG